MTNTCAGNILCGQSTSTLSYGSINFGPSEVSLESLVIHSLGKKCIVQMLTLLT